jgi:hypothetical protein
MEKIKFYNRDGSEVWIEKIGEEGWWGLRMKPDLLFFYTHLLYEEEGQEGRMESVDRWIGCFLSTYPRLRCDLPLEVLLID